MPRSGPVQSAADAGLLGASDRGHMLRALRQDRVIVTRDADLPRLHAAGVEHAGIAYVPHGLGISDTIRGLVLIHEILVPEDMVNHIEVL